MAVSLAPEDYARGVRRARRGASCRGSPPPFPPSRGGSRTPGSTPTSSATSPRSTALPVLTKDDLIHLQAETPPFGGLLAAGRAAPPRLPVARPALRARARRARSLALGARPGGGGLRRRTRSS